MKGIGKEDSMRNERYGSSLWKLKKARQMPRREETSFTRAESANIDRGTATTQARNRRWQLLRNQKANSNMASCNRSCRWRHESIRGIVAYIKQFKDKGTEILFKVSPTFEYEYHNDDLVVYKTWSKQKTFFLRNSVLKIRVTNYDPNF